MLVYCRALTEHVGVQPGLTLGLPQSELALPVPTWLGDCSGTGRLHQGPQCSPSLAQVYPPALAATASWTVVRGVLQGRISQRDQVPDLLLSKHKLYVGAHTGTYAQMGHCPYIFPRSPIYSQSS